MLNVDVDGFLSGTESRDNFLCGGEKEPDRFDPTDRGDAGRSSPLTEGLISSALAKGADAAPSVGVIALIKSSPTSSSPLWVLRIRGPVCTLSTEFATPSSRIILARSRSS